MRGWIEPLRRVPSPLTVAVVCGLALALRLAVSAVSIGSNDAVTWRIFGEEVSRLGPLEPYRLHPYFNQPPLMGWLAAAVFRLHARSGLRFEVLFKLPSILAN